MSDVLRRFQFRAARLYDGIVELALEKPDEGIGWVEALARVDPDNEWAERTIDGAIRDLVVAGVCSISGVPARGHRPDGRRIRVTPLGVGVLEGRLVLIPWTSKIGLGGEAAKRPSETGCKGCRGGGWVRAGEEKVPCPRCGGTGYERDVDEQGSE